jgi:hypothetical protein
MIPRFFYFQFLWIDECPNAALLPGKSKRWVEIQKRDIRLMAARYDAYRAHSTRNLLLPNSQLWELFRARGANMVTTDRRLCDKHQRYYCPGLFCQAGVPTLWTPTAILEAVSPGTHRDSGGDYICLRYWVRLARISATNIRANQFGVDISICQLRGGSRCGLDSSDLAVRFAFPQSYRD